MNWYKRAQFENLSQFEITKEIQKLNPIYLDFLDKEWNNTLSPEDKIKMEEVGNQLNALGRQMKQLVKTQRDISKQLIQEGKGHQVTPINFLDYHNTGQIQDSAYNMYGTKEGVEWLGKKEKYPILLKKEQYGDEEIEFRQEGTENKYVKTDENDEIIRDKKGLAVLMSDEEIREKGLPVYDTTITAFNSQGEPIGWASDEFGADGVWVIKDYQGKGIGTDLLYEFKKQFRPGRRIGQMTNSGRSMAKSYHKKLVEEALRQGKEVPKEILQHYELV